MDEETITPPPAAPELNGGAYTSAASYPGFKPPEQHTLPSGATFLLRKPQIMKMLRKGQIPNPLMQIVNDVFNVRDELELAAEAEAKGMTVEQLQEQRAFETANDAETETPPVPEMPEVTAADGLAFMDVIVWASIVAPIVEMAPMVGDSPLTEAGHLSYDALDDEDIQWILKWANGNVEESMATFPPGLGRASDGGGGGEVRAETERPARDPA